jgi:hypothetical protein
MLYNLSFISDVILFGLLLGRGIFIYISVMIKFFINQGNGMTGINNLFFAKAFPFLMFFRQNMVKNEGAV